MPNTPARLSPLPPGSPLSPPLGTVRPVLTTLEEIREVEQEMAVSQEAPPPPEVARGVQLRKLGRLEAVAVRHDWRLDVIERTQAEIVRRLDANTRVSSKGAWMAQVGAYAAAAWPVFLVVSKALGQWGDAHPEAQVGVTGLVLAVFKAVATVKASTAAGAASASADPSPPPPPPPGHT